MSRPAFLVEGKMEQLVVQTLCPGAPVRIINCNGDKVALESIAKRIGTLARLLGNRHWPVVVVLDREEREMSCSDMKTQLEILVRLEGVTAPIVFGIPDRMIENWILADFENFCRFADVTRGLFTPSMEGSLGESRLKAFLPRTASYVKTIHGVLWFTSGDAEVMRKNSESFNEFASELSELECKWLAEQRFL